MLHFASRALAVDLGALVSSFRDSSRVIREHANACSIRCSDSIVVVSILRFTDAGSIFSSGLTFEKRIRSHFIVKDETLSLIPCRVYEL